MDQKSTPFFKGALLAVAAIFVVLFGIYIMEGAREHRILSLSTWHKLPETTSISGVAKTTFKPGESLIITYHIDRQPMSCWAVWVDTISGPVSYQFPAQRSQVFVDEVTRVDLSLLKTLPPSMPSGEYHWYQMSYPVCQGRQMTPFRNDTGIILTIVQK